MSCQPIFDRQVLTSPAVDTSPTLLENTPSHIQLISATRNGYAVIDESTVAPVYNPRTMTPWGYEEWLKVRSADRYSIHRLLMTLTSVKARQELKGIVIPWRELGRPPPSMTQNILWSFLLRRQITPLVRIVPQYFRAVVMCLRDCLPGVWPKNPEEDETWQVHRVGSYEVFVPPFVQLLDLEIIRSAIPFLFYTRRNAKQEWIKPVWMSVRDPRYAGFNDNMLLDHLNWFISRCTAFTVCTEVQINNDSPIIVTRAPVSHLDWKDVALTYCDKNSILHVQKYNVFYTGISLDRYRRRVEYLNFQEKDEETGET